MTKPKTRKSKFRVPIPDASGEHVAFEVPITITEKWNDAIGTWFLTPESQEEIENTKARYMGLLLPEELKALRLRYRMSQKQIGELLQIGEKSWTRWETGRQRPSRSINLLLRALNDGILNPAYLSRCANRNDTDWSGILLHGTELPVSMDLTEVSANVVPMEIEEPTTRFG